MKPRGNAPTLVNYGNATVPFVGSMPTIDNRVGVGAPYNFRAPGMTGSAPRLSILNKITPPNVNAAQGIGIAQSRVRTIAGRGIKRTADTARGWVRALMTQQRKTPKFMQRISTAYWSK